jgi:hypothetical protein
LVVVVVGVLLIVVVVDIVVVVSSNGGVVVVVVVVVVVPCQNEIVHFVCVRVRKRFFFNKCVFVKGLDSNESLFQAIK